jgi:hypothetical protein
MTNCLITSGYVKGCRDNIGGIKKLYLANLDSIASVAPVLNTIGSPEDEGEIDTIVMDTTLVFYEYELTKDNSSFTIETSVDPTTGIVLYAPTLNFSIPKFDLDARNTLNIITRNDIVAIVEDNLGNKFLLGEEFGLDATTATGTSGQAKTDLNGLTIALVGSERFAPRSISSDFNISTILEA